MSRLGSDKTHILMVGPDRSVHGGISAVVNGYYSAGLDNMVDLEYIGTMKEGSKPYKLLVAIVAFLNYEIRLSHADAVHIHMASDSSLIRKSFFIKAAHRRGKRIILHQHGGDLENWFAALSEKKKARVIRLFNMADTRIVLSPLYKSVLENMSAADSSGKVLRVERPITVMPNSVSLPGRPDMFGADPSATPEHPGILFLGRICVQKGINELIGCVPAIKERFPGTRIYLAGIWEDPEIEKAVSEYPDDIEYVGWADEAAKKELFGKCGILALPSYFEGQGVAVLEALSYGLVVVASDVGGIPMMIKDHETGFLVKPRDTESLKNALLHALDPASAVECAAIRREGRALVEREYDPEAGLRRLVAIYQRQA